MHTTANNKSTTIASDNGTAVTMADDVFPVAPFYLTVCEQTGGPSLEILEVTEKNGTVFYVVRQIEGTQANYTGKRVELRVVAQIISELQAAVTARMKIVRPANNRSVDRAAIQAAIDSADEVFLAPGVFLLSADGLSNPSELLLLTSSKKINGSGYPTKLRLASDVSATCDLLGIKPADNIRMNGLDLGSFCIDSESGAPGRHAIHFDLTNIIVSYPHAGEASEIHNINIGDTKTSGVSGPFIGGYDIKHTNPNGEVLNGLFATTFRTLQLSHGAQFQRLGDSVYFRDIRLLTQNGGHSGIDIQSQVAGANVVIFDSINGYGVGTLLKLNGVRFKLYNTNLEMYDNPDYTNNLATVWISGGWLPGTELCSIENCQIRNMAGTKAHACYIQSADRTTIRANNFQSVDAGYFDLKIASSCTNTIITSPNKYNGQGKSIDDTSVIYIGNSNV